MTTIEHEASATAAGAVLDRAADALAARATADVGLLVAAAEWAELHPALDDAPACWGTSDLYGEGAIPIAGEGAPLVSEFAPLELAAVLGWTPVAAQSLMGEALEIKSRLPRLWGLVLEQVVPVHLARAVAAETIRLGYDAARDADRLVTADPRHLTRRRVRVLVDEARLYHEPDHVVDDEQRALAARRVEVFPGRTPATADILMTLDTEVADAFDRAVARAAEALGALGDTDNLDLRRAKAVGVLADPQRALDLLNGTAALPRNRPPATLWLHLTDTSLLDIDAYGGGVVSDRLGAMSTDLLKAWLADSTVIVRPVLDLSRSDSVDRHDPPEWMSSLVRLRDTSCVFPGCQRPSHACDLDHIEPYRSPDDGGPPGQTHPSNLAPLCRRHHRAKTFGEWSYTQLLEGGYRWRGPTGRLYLSG